MILVETRHLQAQTEGGRGRKECLTARDPWQPEQVFGVVWSWPRAGGPWWSGAAKGSFPGLVDVLVDVVASRQLLCWRHRFLMGHLGSSRGEVFISLSDNSWDHDRQLWWYHSLIFCTVFVLLLVWHIICRLVLLNYPHASCFHSRKVTSSGLGFLFGRRWHGCCQALLPKSRFVVLKIKTILQFPGRK